jgi:hypothetical protein
LLERKRRLGELVGRGSSREEAARAVGVSTRTAYEYLRDPAVVAVVARTRTETLDPEQAVLNDALGAVRRDGTPDHAIRLKALELKARYLPENPDDADTIEYVYDLPKGATEYAVLVVHREAEAEAEAE